MSLLRSLVLGAGLLALAACDGSSSRSDSTSAPPDGSAPGSSDSGPPADASAAIPFGTPGPWPSDPVTVFGSAQGLPSEIVDISADEAQNIWAVSRDALYVLRPGQGTFRKYGAADGLHLSDAEPPGITAATGGGANEGFVGYQGTDVVDPQQDPDRFKGKLDRVLLKADGSLEVHRYDVHNNDAVGWDANGDLIRLPDGRIDPNYTDWSFNEDRTVLRFLYDHHYHRGTLYVGYNHGVGRVDAGRPDPIHGLDYADHVHPEVINASGTKRMGEWRALALDPSPRADPTGGSGDGMLWMGGRWTAGALTWTEGLWQWTNNSRAPRHPFWMAISGPPVFPVADGDSVYLSAIAALSDGTVYFASGPGYDAKYAGPFGLAMWSKGGGYTYLSPQADLGLPGGAVTDLQRLPDDTLLVLLSGGDLWRWDPNPKPNGTLLGRIQGLPGAATRVTVDAMVDPPAAWVATRNGAAVLRLR